MTNEEYYSAIDSKIELLDLYRKDLISLGARVIGMNLFKEDFYFTSALNKTVSILDAFKIMLRERNLEVLGILVRTQIDICMRVYAPYIAANRDELINGFIDGKSIRDFRDDNNKKMTDVNLRERLEVYDDKLSNTYTRSSGYVHFSSVALHASIQAMKDNHIDFSIGLPLREEANIILLEAIEAFVHYIKLEIELIEPVAESKRRVDELLEAQDTLDNNIIESPQ